MRGIVGVDLGGTQMRAGLIEQGKIQRLNVDKVNAKGTVEEVLDDLFKLIDSFNQDGFEALGIGVPSVVDVERGIVYDVENIRSWKSVPLKSILNRRYKVPVFINNDANCFALGEKKFGQAKKLNSFVGMTIGTGLGAGIVIESKLYNGKNCGAGEFGMIPYRNRNFEAYTSSHFFRDKYSTTGLELYQKASKNDKQAIEIFEEYGKHLGNVIKMILYTLDPEKIILGGSISKSFSFFKESMWNSINEFGFKESLKDFDVVVSSLKESGVLGAAALCM